MKKRNILKFILPTIGFSLVVTPFFATITTSCGANGLDKAPDDFYWNSDQDCTVKTNKKFMSNHNKFIVKDKLEFFQLLTDANKYTDNMIKWDLIATYCFSTTSDTKPFTTHIDDFGVERVLNEKISIKYKITETDKTSGEKIVYFSSATGGMASEYSSFTIDKNNYDKKDEGYGYTLSLTDESWLYSNYLVKMNSSWAGLSCQTFDTIFISSSKE